MGDVSGEAMVGGPLALIEDDDEIVINIPERKLYAVLADSEFDRRRTKWTPPPMEVTSGYLARYAKCVTSADKGAVLRD